MKIALVRHAIAEDREKYSRSKKDDSKRPLTRKGEKLFLASLKGIRLEVGKVDLIATSPFIRARETAKLLRKIYPRVRMLELVPLSAGKKPHETLTWLRRQKRNAAIILVGHEPDLSQLIGLLCWKKNASRVKLKKGALCILEFSDKIIAGKAEISCLIQPQTLRSLKG